MLASRLAFQDCYSWLPIKRYFADGSKKQGLNPDFVGHYSTNKIVP
jgi:hypothetical protein